MRYLLLLMACAGCDFIEHPVCAIERQCTDDLRFVRVHVTDMAGNAIVGATPTTTIDGRVVTVDQNLTLGTPGDYIVLEDGTIHDDSDVTFEISSPQGSAVGQFQISVETCNCDHIGNVDGPRVMVVK
jgi:hypothetical protein